MKHGPSLHEENRNDCVDDDGRRAIKSRSATTGQRLSAYLLADAPEISVKWRKFRQSASPSGDMKPVKREKNAITKQQFRAIVGHRIGASRTRTAQLILLLHRYDIRVP